ncbi:AdeC/AdeK/OprM family multidrug efflux complex outer membrane factor [Pandoraea pulmonicola]|uniref:Multidrug transporter n=1 Tax=Pandoraea pulmonicola TaxID=93221 RepID=A0AAJ5D223_PANPU|nr:AdeC/AdeK/OprM family multidrug efflux complex outer membrane factor [Pandoraea pulmonicola]AJC19520.1 multidrug transporter [Pandoraea pulmonicola]SUA92421.1 Outer membrane protein oprM precursor [Pandoraea pulmonicola]
MKHKALPIALAAALLAGCTLAPHYERPEAPIATTFPNGPAYKTPAGANQNGATNANAVAAADLGWRDFFTDPRLQKLIEIALQNNRDLRVSMLNIEAARAQYQIQRSALLPSIGAAGQASVQRTPADMTASGRAGISRSYQVGVGFTSYELDLFGRIQSLKDQALETYLATEDTAKAAHITLVSEVATAYLTWLADQELLRLTADTLKSQQSSYDLTKRSFNVGTASGLDLRQAQTPVDTARANFAQYTRQVAQDENALALLIGQPLPADLPPGRSLDGQGLLTDLPAGLPSDLLLRRPDVTAAEHTLKGANANIGAARAAFFPSISLTANAGTASASLSNLFKGGQGAWSFAPTITLPIFAGGQNVANLDLAKVQKRIEIANYEKAIQTAFREVSDGLAARGTLDDQIAAQESLVKASEESYKLSDLRYRNGVDSYLNALVSQRSLYSAQQTLIATRLARWSNLVTLYKALGGGWEERTVPANADAASAPAASAS